ncbi:MAG: hypothetical protein RLZZ338_1460, partial [Cyanobacteriota bacterium]
PIPTQKLMIHLIQQPHRVYLVGKRHCRVPTAVSLTILIVEPAPTKS